MAETNLIKKEDLARVREVEFTQIFTENVKKLIEALGVTRKVAKTAGSVLKTYKATGVLEDGNVAEGDTIPLSKYQTEELVWGEAKLKKWRKSTSAEAIIDRGYDQAVEMTTDRMTKDIQKGIRKDFFDFLATGSGRAHATTFQGLLAQMWGALQVMFEDDDTQAVYFINQLDIADYLATANITVQTAFGMNYVEDFLGLGTVIMNSSVPKGRVYATVQDNIVLYYIPVNGSDLGEAFEFTSDETGYIGIHEKPDYDNATVADTVVSGIGLFCERIDGVIVGNIGSSDVTGHVYTAQELKTMTTVEIKELADKLKYTVSGATKEALIESFLTAQG